MSGLKHGILLFTTLCFLAGGLHVVAPDHWVPASILSWQKGWRTGRLAAFSAVTFGGHIFLGFLIFSVFENLLGNIPSSDLLIFSFVLVALVALLRAMRFSRIREVIRGGAGSIWGAFTVFSLLGPAESMIPILLKAKYIGVGYLLPLAAFYLGTLVVGLGLIVSGRMVWDRPNLLPRGLYLAQKRVTVLPVLAVMAIGLTFLLKP